MYPTFSSYKGRIVLPGRRVQVYRNLHKPGVTYSIRDAKTRRVLGHASNLLLVDCKFKVNQSGREKVRQTKKKNVHAWIEGSFAPVKNWTDRYYNGGSIVRYNPYVDNHFMVGDIAIRESDIVYIKNENVWVH